MKAAIHLGPDDTENFEVYKFSIAQKLILDHSEEILNVKPIEGTAPSWTRSTLSHDQETKWTKSKVHVYSDSVLCLEKLSYLSEANRRWEGQVADFLLSACCEELLRIDENQLSSIGIFPRTCIIADSAEDPERLCKNGTLNLKFF